MAFRTIPTTASPDSSGAPVAVAVTRPVITVSTTSPKISSRTAAPRITRPDRVASAEVVAQATPRFSAKRKPYKASYRATYKKRTATKKIRYAQRVRRAAAGEDD